VFKWVIKTIVIGSSFLALLIINVKILLNFQKEWCTFGRNKDIWKKEGFHFGGLNTLNMQFKKKICVKLWACKLYN
jgi:hypothetical protein